MDHSEQHHQKHIKEREHEKKEQKQYERETEKSRMPLHPAWLFIAGVVLMLLAMLAWIMFF
jgi:hypothetical protein